MNRPTKLGLAAILLWSTLIPVVRSLAEKLGPLTTTGLVFVLGGLLSLAATRLFRPGTPLLAGFGARYLLVCGGLFLAYFACLYPALGLAPDRLAALEVGLVNYLWPSLTVLLSVPLLNVAASWLLVPGALLAAAGTVLVLGSTGDLSLSGFAGHLALAPLPYLLGLGAALSWALYSNLSRRLAPGAPGSAVPLFMLVTGLVLGGAQAVFPEAHHWSARAGAEVVFLALASTLGYVFWDIAMRRGDVVLVATLSYFTPLVSTIIGAAYLGVRPGSRLWVGGALLVGAAYACRAATRAPAVPRAALDETHLQGE